MRLALLVLLLLVSKLDAYEFSLLRINEAQLDVLAELLHQQDLSIADWSDIFPDGLSIEDKIDYLFAFICIDFRHWDLDATGVVRDFYTQTEQGRVRGSRAMTELLKACVQEGLDFYRAEHMASLSDEELAPYLSGEDSAGEPMQIPALKERVAILNTCGQILIDKYAGSFTTLLEESRGYAFCGGTGIVELLVRDFPRFRDSYTIDGEEIAIYKLAQLLVAALHCALGQHGELRLEIQDLESLSICADYQIPRALRALGVLEYSTPLAELVDQQQLIPAASRAEIELRLGSIVATERLRQKLPFPVTALELDAFLWSMGRERSQAPHHLTLTTMY